MVLIDPKLKGSTREFDAEVLILHHPTTIKENYQVNVVLLFYAARIYINFSFFFFLFSFFFLSLFSHTAIFEQSGNQQKLCQ
jgi:hypothetical protein